MIICMYDFGANDPLSRLESSVLQQLPLPRCEEGGSESKVCSYKPVQGGEDEESRLLCFNLFISSVGGIPNGCDLSCQTLHPDYI